MITRKHYKEFSDMMVWVRSCQRSKPDYEVILPALEQVEMCLAGILSKSSKRFDVKRFYANCEGDK